MINKNLSDAIYFLRCPMALLVICVHADFTNNFSYLGKSIVCQQDFGYHIVNFISHTLADFAVPLFYLISGILYYNSNENYGYVDLLKKKITTLILPYVCWNIIFFLAFFSNKGFTFIEFIHGMWYIPKGECVNGVLAMPWDGPLWFLRDLIVVFILTPILSFLIRATGCLYIILLTLLYATKIVSWYIIPGLSISSLLMFSAGMYLQYISKSYDWLSKLQNCKGWLCVLVIVANICTYLYSLYGSTSLVYNLMHFFAIISGIAFAFSVCNLTNDKVLSFMKNIGTHTFVIFASHTLFLTYVIKCIMLPFGYELAKFQTLIIFFASVIITYVASHILGVIINKIRILRLILSGGR